jgi:protein-S-isoprenylcysteine O-methyltransferase Ste14
MNSGILLLCLINFGFIALLPRKFFKQGAKLNAHFWLTAAPLFAAPAVLALTYVGYIPQFIDWNDPWAKVLGLLAVMVSCVSIVFLGMAIGTHRIPIHMFHDEKDTKASHLVTWGPYRYVRHPIYSAYLMALFASLLFSPSIGTLACFIYGVVVLGSTAAKEEVKLSQEEEIGPEYVEYMKYTGRFLPPLSAFTLQNTHKQPTEAQEKTPSEVK